MIEYHSIQNILDLCKEQDKKIWEVVLQADMDESGASGEQVFEKMRFMYRAMQEADQSYEANLKSQSGMVGGDGEKMRQYNATGKNLCSEYSSLAMEKALKMGESNACMKRIVAAPTAGSCGVIPAVLLSYEESKNTEEDELVKALFVCFRYRKSCCGKCINCRSIWRMSGRNRNGKCDGCRGIGISARCR